MSADTGGSNRLPRPLGAGWIALGTVSRPNGDTWALGALPALGPDGSWHPAMLLSPVVESRFDMPRVLEAFQQWSAPARAGRKLRPAPDLDVLFRRVPGSAERAPHPVPGLPPQAVLDAAAEVPAEVAAAVGRGELSVLQVWKHHPGLFTQPEVGPLASTRPTLAPLATSDLDALDAAYSLALQATRRRSPFAGSPGRPPERHIAPGARALYDALAEELGPAPSRTEREMAQCFVAAVSRGDRLLPDLPDLLDLFKRLRDDGQTVARRRAHLMVQPVLLTDWSVPLAAPQAPQAGHRRWSDPPLSAWLRSDRAARMLFVIAGARVEALRLPLAGGDYLTFLTHRHLPFHRIRVRYELPDPAPDDRDGSLREALGLAHVRGDSDWVEITRCGFVADRQELLDGLPRHPSRRELPAGGSPDDDSKRESEPLLRRAIEAVRALDAHSRAAGSEEPEGV